MAGGRTGTSRKSLDVMLAEGKKPHRSNKELQERAKNEKAAYTGITIKEHPEVKSSEVAHKEYLKIIKILNAVNKNDASFENIVNRYCEIVSEIDDLRNSKESIKKSLSVIESKINDGDENVSKLFSSQTNLTKTLMSIDGKIDNKRKILFDYEKQLGFTIDSASKIVNTKTEEEVDPLLAALQD